MKDEVSAAKRIEGKNNYNSKRMKKKIKNNKKFGNISSKFTSKPSYDLYVQLWYTLDMYLFRINIYIYFKYYEGNIPNINLIQDFSIDDFNKFRHILEYDYQVFKTLLFLYGDLEYYLEKLDNVKNILEVNSSDLKFQSDFNILNIKFKNKAISAIDYWNKIQVKKPINLGTNLEILGLGDKILKYNVYPIYDLDTKYKKAVYIKEYRLYKKYNDKISVRFIFNTVQFINKIIDLSYYEKYIEDGYKEGSAEMHIDLTKKYKGKIKILDLEIKKLGEVLSKE